MPLLSHPVIPRLVQALNGPDGDAVAALFAPTAVVRDGGLEYRGKAAVQRWFLTLRDKYLMQWEIAAIRREENEWILHALVSGTFEGSPVPLDHRLSLENGKIIRLDI